MTGEVPLYTLNTTHAHNAARDSESQQNFRPPEEPVGDLILSRRKIAVRSIRRFVCRGYAGASGQI